MSDIVSDEHRNLVAAEYVLGTLDGNERARANDLLVVDPEFRGLVSTWERRLGELYLMVEPIEPDSEVWQRIKARLDGVVIEGVKSTGEAVETSSPDEPPPVPDPEAGTFPEIKPSEAGPVAGEFEPAPGRPQAERTEPRQPADPAEQVEPIPEQLEPIARQGEPISASALPEQISESSAQVSSPHLQDRGARHPIAIPPDPRRRGAARWRALAACTTIIAATLAALMAAWRYVPDRLPPQLRPAVVLNMPGAPANPARKPAPAGSQFKE
jgi:hypothetical protein